MVDMFQALSEERVQLCLTLAEGADRISVYLAVGAEAWPVGMVPGFCTVQVRRLLCGLGLEACCFGFFGAWCLGWFDALRPGGRVVGGFCFCAWGCCEMVSARC